MKLQSPFFTKLGGLLITEMLRGWMATLDTRAGLYNRAVDPGLRRLRPHYLYVFWHEYILCPLYLRGHCNIAMLLSRHRDAEILLRVAGHLGYGCVRGSTARGGAAALRQLLAVTRGMHLAITPDGPRGPRRRLAPGAVYLAAKLALPLVPVGVGYDRPWRAKSWDHFAVPRPFSRARIIFGPAIPVPPDLDRPGLERCRDQVEGLLERLTGAAETWAASGSHLPGELMLRRLLGPWPNGNLGTIRPQPAVMGSGAANGRGLSGGDDAAARSF